MSYDFLLFKAPGPGPMATWTADTLEPLGSADELKRRISAVLPDLCWTQFQRTWFGGPPVAAADRCPEVQLTPDDGGAHRMVTVRRSSADELARLCDALGLVAFDCQTCELVHRPPGSTAV